VADTYRDLRTHWNYSTLARFAATPAYRKDRSLQ